MTSGCSLVQDFEVKSLKHSTVGRPHVTQLNNNRETTTGDGPIAELRDQTTTPQLNQPALPIHCKFINPYTVSPRAHKVNN